MKRVTIWVRHRDIATFFWVNKSWKCAFYDRVMPLVTHLGGAVWCMVLCLALLLTPNQQLRPMGIHLTLALVISLLIVTLFKRTMPRLRPYQALPDVSTGRSLMRDASFPSGHTTAAFCKATTLSMAFPALGPLFFALAAMVGLSRVYLGQHYPTDVLIGACLGLFTSLLLP